jgi:hypothetical protein
MLSAFLSRDELAELVGCEPTSRACMRRWLSKHGWPFEVDRNNFPKVLRSYYDARMTGSAPPAVAAAGTEPNRALFKAAS